MHSDSTLIDSLGGPAAVASLLGYPKDAAKYRRVWNWKKRGIPARVKVQRPDLFLPGYVPQAAAATSSASE